MAPGGTFVKRLIGYPALHNLDSPWILEPTILCIERGRREVFKSLMVWLQGINFEENGIEFEPTDAMMLEREGTGSVQMIPESQSREDFSGGEKRV